MASTSTYFTVLQFSGKSLFSTSLHAHSQTHLRMLTFICPSCRTKNCGLHDRTGIQKLSSVCLFVSGTDCLCFLGERWGKELFKFQEIILGASVHFISEI